MLGKKRTKNSRQRGSSSHGWGHKKKHRGSGHRGGFGLSGTGARGDAQKAGLMAKGKGILMKISAKKGVPLKKFMKNYVHFGKKGFKSIHKAPNNVLSLNYIETHFDKMVEVGMIVKEKSEFVFDATSAGYDKILGKGTFTKKVTIIVDEISANAKLKVEEAGGKVILPKGDFEETSSEK
jgi:large subunit ribosomal protein L15